MILSATREQAAARRQHYATPGGAEAFVSTYLGTNRMELAAQRRESDAQAGRGGPMAYLVEQIPGSTVEPHYHQVDQFQLFVGGGGRIGTHPVDGLVVHYAGAHSPYGPIAADDRGIAYVTLRRDWDPGAQWMPGAAAALRALPERRHVAFTSGALARCADLRRLEGVDRATVFESDRDGSGAWLMQAGPGATVRADPVGGGGLFWYVLAGGLEMPGGASATEPGELGERACVYFSEDEAPVDLRAGAGGVELLQARFARR